MASDIFPICSLTCSLGGDYAGCGFFDVSCQCITPTSVQDVSDCIQSQCTRRQFRQWRNSFEDFCEMLGVDDPNLPEDPGDDDPTPTPPTLPTVTLPTLTPPSQTSTDISSSTTSSSTSSTTSPATSHTIAPTVSTTSSHPAASTPSEAQTNNVAASSGSNKGAVTGGVIGGLIALVVVVGILVCCGMAYRRRQYQRQQAQRGSMDLFAPIPPPKDNPGRVNWNPFAPSDAALYSDAGSYNGQAMSQVTGHPYAVPQPYIVPPSPSIVTAGVAGVGAGRRRKSEDVAPTPVTRAVEESELPYTRSEYPASEVPPSSYANPGSAGAGILRRMGSLGSSSLHRSGSSSSSRSGRLGGLFGGNKRLSSRLTPQQLQQVQSLAAQGAPGAVVVDAMETMLRENYQMRTGASPSQERLPGYGAREA